MVQEVKVKHCRCNDDLYAGPEVQQGKEVANAMGWRKTGVREGIAATDVLCRRRYSFVDEKSVGNFIGCYSPVLFKAYCKCRMHRAMKLHPFCSSQSGLRCFGHGQLRS